MMRCLHLSFSVTCDMDCPVVLRDTLPSSHIKLSRKRPFIESLYMIVIKGARGIE